MDNTDNLECAVHESTALLTTRFWLISFNLNSGGQGVSMVKADNANMAERILKSSCIYNGTPNSYQVYLIEEIDVPPCCGLMAEVNVECSNNN